MYIYKITNLKNDKIYIGKTLRPSVYFRLQEHLRSAYRKGYENRPLYKAIRKYGKENFVIEVLEKVTDENLISEREEYYINLYDSFKNGYNATTGGDGVKRIDYDEVIRLWNLGWNYQRIAESVGSKDTDYIRVILSTKGITKEDKEKRRLEAVSRGVEMEDKKTQEIIMSFSSIADAYRHLGKKHSGHIAQAISGKRKSAYGYKWRYTA